MEKDIVTLDVETTGLNPKEDFIIQLSMVKFNRYTFEEIDSRDWYIKPIHKYEISQGAFEAHGLSKEFIEEHGVDIRTIAQDFEVFISGCDFLTYNGNNFDFKFIEKDFSMIGCKFDFSGRKFYDAYALEARFHPRTLSAVYNKYTGKEIENAHNALADVKATIEVFKSQLQENNLGYEDINDYNECNLLSPEGSIRNAALGDDPMKIVFAFGKYKDSEFMEILKKDPAYIKWFGENVASAYTKNVLNKYVKECRQRVKK